MQENDYIPHFQLGHPGAFELAQRVSRLLPEQMNHVFFTNSGSESVDTALKIIMAYHRAIGQSQRLRFVSRERAYHGVNLGGISLGGMVRNRELSGHPAGHRYHASRKPRNRLLPAVSLPRVPRIGRGSGPLL